MNFCEKYTLLHRLMTDHKRESFVETGTYEAKMSLKMSDLTSNVRSIELSEKLHNEALVQVKKAKKDGVITLILGNSAEQLPKALDGASKPLVWLDAHWSAGKTVRDDSGSDTPIVAELHALKEWGGDAVIAIDDLWCFNGKNGYPTFERLREIVRELWPTATLTRVDECVWFQVDPA